MNSHTFLARVLKKWNMSDIICNNLRSILHFRQTCQILADQVFLADSDADSCRSRHFLQVSWPDLARQCLKIERNSARKCLKSTENVEIVFLNFKPKLHVKPNANVEQDSTAYNTMKTFMLSGIFSRAELSCDRRFRHFFQDQTFSSKIFQDTGKNNALSSKIVEVKPD